MKKILLYTFMVASGIFASCNDYLDCEPITSVSTTVYLYSESDLAAYAAKFYNDSENENNDEYGNILPSHGSGSYNMGLFDDDNGTDNQTADTPNKLLVPQRFENGEITGNDANIKHYIGEVYFFRAYIYFMALRNLGDFPIIKEVVSDDYDVIREASKRRPRNEVARFILSDLDNAYNYMLPTAPVTNRLNRDCAALVKSRVALFEGTWEKYHKGTAFVPGGPGWPGATMDYLKDFNVNIDSEIRYFLEQAVEAADIVAKAHPILNNDYSAMFNSVDLSGMNEVLLWRKYSLNSEATSYHFVVSYLQRNGGGNVAFTRSMVDSYLMKNGLPIYADNSDYQGDGSYEDLFTNRDPRMEQTILKTGDLLSDGPNLIEYIKNDGKGYFYRAPIFEGQVENSNATGYCLRKGLNTSGSMQTTKESYTGCPIFRAAEAYLNYLEAYYELHGNLQGNCDTYWKALRTRAGVDTDYQNTIDNTIMEKEKNDWGSYSTGTQVNTTLYNIRRERRIELAAEGHRMNDLKRWRALDQVKNIHIQGCNFWESIYLLYTNPQPEDAASTLAKMTLTEYGTTEETANVSSRNDPYAEGKYLLPYRKNKANIGFDGLNWNTAKYLYPISNREFRLTTATAGSGDFDSSSIYQNPGWSKNDGTLPVGD